MANLPRFAMVLCLAASFAACKKAEQAVAPAPRSASGGPGNIPKLQGATARAPAVSPPEGEGEAGKQTGDEDRRRRRELVAREYAKVDPYPIVNSVLGLSDTDQRLVRELFAAARLVDELNALQINPRNPAWAGEIAREGSEEDRGLYTRNQHPWCEDDDDPLCSSHPEHPVKQIGAYHWPEGMTDAEYEAIRTAPNAKALLSPFTVVRRGANGGFEAIPYAKDPILGPRMGKLGKHLREAAKHSSHPSLRNFLLARAEAFLSAEPFPYDDSDYLWIGLEGDWEVTVGPYEVYKNPRQTKARFEMFFGRVAPEVSAALAPLRAKLQEMEAKVAALVGEEIYTPRKLDPRIAVKAMDVWYAAGDGRNPQGATAAFHLPNRGKSVDEGLYKKVMLANHMEAFAPIMKARGDEILHPSLRPYVSAQADIMNTTFHEFCHGFGSHDELEVVTAEGTKTTVHDALKEFSSLMEEEKADVLGLWLVAHQLETGAIDLEHAKRRYVSALMHVFGLLQYSFKGTYPRMVAIELGWYMEQGAVSYDPGTGFWSIDFDKLPGAIESLAQKVARIQLTGDYLGAKALVGRYVSQTDAGPEPSALLKAPLEDVAKRFAAKKIKSVSISYRIDGLD